MFSEEKRWLNGVIIGLLGGALLGQGEPLWWCVFAALTMMCIADITPALIVLKDRLQWDSYFKELRAFTRALGRAIKDREEKKKSYKNKTIKRAVRNFAERIGGDFAALPRSEQERWYEEAEQEEEKEDPINRGAEL